MTTVQSVRSEHARRLMRLIHEVHEIGPHTRAAREHALAALCKLVGAGNGFFIVDDHFIPKGRGPLAHIAGSMVVEGAVDAVAGEGRAAHPMLRGIMRRTANLAAGEIVAAVRRDVCSDAEWYGSSFFAEHIQPEGYDDLVTTIEKGQVRGRVIAVTLGRATDDRPFSEGERDVVLLFHHACARLLMPSPEDELTPRAQATLALLRSSASDKEIAAKLGISHHTVHQYVKEIFRVFGVQSRAELVARLLAEGSGKR
jgi:DNA-binding CsgD family transcriptional regulator